MTARAMTTDETVYLTKKLTNALQRNPFGIWKPEAPDHPQVEYISLHKEIDPLLGYDKKWLIAALLDHLAVTRRRFKNGGLNSNTLHDLQFSLSRIDEFAGEQVPGLEDLREIATKGIY
jgi:hypothetical protein